MSNEIAETAPKFNIKLLIRRLFFLTLGAAIVGFGLENFLVPNDIIDGGIVGISIVVNKYKGIRCGLCANEYMARMCRQHNDANVLAFGARVVGQAVALAMVDAYLTEPFAGERHAVRVNDIKAMEEEFYK